VTYQLTTAKVWDGSQWVAAAGGSKPWWETYGQVQRGLALGTSVTSSATIHTKGAWTEVIASTTGNADFLVIGAQVSTNSTDTASLFDVGFGAAGAETTKIENVAIGSWASLAVVVPFAIPSGTRIAIRTQSIVSAKAITFYVQAFDSGNYSNAPTAVDVIGTSTVTSRGTALSSTANTYVQLSASSANAYKAIAIVPSMADASSSVFNETYTLATGPSGSEIDRGSTTVNTTAGEAMQPQGMQALGLVSGSFPAGTRLAVKGNQSISGTNFDVCLIGIR